MAAQKHKSDLPNCSTPGLKPPAVGCRLEEPCAPVESGGSSLKNLTTSTASPPRKHLHLRPMQICKQRVAHTIYMECTSLGIGGQRSRPCVVAMGPVPIALSHRAMEEAASQCFPLCACMGALSGLAQLLLSPAVTSRGDGSCNTAVACLFSLSSRCYTRLPQ